MELNYTPDGRTLGDFMRAEAFFRGLQGPIGSGKSVCCVIELARQALMQPRALDPKTAWYDEAERRWKGERTGPRRVRTAVVRNTTPQLEMTTMKTWLEWLPEHEWGKVRWRAPYRQDIVVPELDLHWEVWFLALDRDEDVKKLLSFELTNVWFNEARELSRGIVTAGLSRVKRFPRAMDGGSHRFFGIADTNAPDEEHWWAIMSGQAEAPDWMSEEDRLTLLKPHNWEFFTQPPAVLDIWDGSTLVGYELNPDRDNARFTDESYYDDLREGQTRDWIMNMLQNKIGRIFNGRPVYRDFNEMAHIAAEPIQAEPDVPIHVGLDFGTTPAAAIMQDVRGQVRIIGELVSRDTHAKEFGKALIRHLRETWPDHSFVFTGDPAGDNATGVDDTTAYQVLKGLGIDVQPSWTNDPVIRIGAVQERIVSMTEGRPALLVSPSATFICNGFKGGYCYKKDTEEVDKKSIFSHVHDGVQYAILRMGYGRELLGRKKGRRLQTLANRKQNLFDRGGGMTAKQRHRESILSRR